MADLNTILQQLQTGVGFAAGQAREAMKSISSMQGDHALIRQELERQARDMENVAQAIRGVGGSGGNGGGIRDPWHGTVRNVSGELFYIDEVPGRRIPFDVLVTIPIGANVTSEQQQTQQISQDGPFVAMLRMATFQSALQVNRISPISGQPASFQGRSFGRFRPIHSAWDINDASVPFNVIAPIAFPGTGAPVYASPTNHSAFRTMEFDGLVEFFNQGAAYPRSNMQVPTTFWSTQINAPFQLGALDFFERGETLQWKVVPTHVNNPSAGNAFGFGAGGVYPFIDSQYDVHEGIVDPNTAGVTTDPLQRLPDGFLYIGFHGFRIVQPPGPIRLT